MVNRANTVSCHIFIYFQIVSCSGDGTIFHTDIERTDATGSHLFNCHFGTTYEVGA